MNAPKKIVDKEMQTQSNRKKVIDTRTFPEIWRGLTPLEQELIGEKLKRDLVVSRQALWCWTEGKRNPLPLYRKAIADILNKIGICASVKTLFPNIKKNKDYGESDC